MYLKRVILSCILLATAAVFSQSPRQKQANWQQRVSYKIQVSLDDATHTLNAHETLFYTNHSPDTLRELWFHLWPNAYKNRNTAFAKQQLENGKTDFHFAADSMRGYIDGLAFTAGGTALTMSFHPLYEDVCRLQLNKPLLPGESIEIETPFRVKLPAQFSRLGHVGQDYQVTQWYPKPAVYDVNGWNVMPYLDQGEFYSEYGSFEVAITLPGAYAVAATGVLQNEADRAQNTKASKTLVWKQDHIHDFAWFANKTFIIQKDSVTLPGGNTVHTYGYYPAGMKRRKNAGPVQITTSINKALQYYSKRVGTYPYTAATAVIGPLFAGGGMEYPMITICQDASAEVIVHEVGHNWFYGILGSNERRYPWMDESINSYYESACMYDAVPDAGPFKNRKLVENGEYWLGRKETYMLMLLQGRRNEDQAVNLPAEEYTDLNYGAAIYAKGPLLMAYLEKYLGDTLFDKCMQAYYDKFKFRHPLPQDIQDVFESVSGKNMGWFFKDILSSEDDLDLRPDRGAFKFLLYDINRKMINGAYPEINLANNIKNKPFRLAIPGNLENPGSIQVNLTPVAAYNLYDKWQFGGLIYNRMAPVKKTEYFLMPMYSTGNKTLSGYAKLHFNLPVNNRGMYRAEPGIAASSFSFKPNTVMNQYYRVNPYLTLYFKDRGKLPKRKFRSLNLDLSLITLKKANYALYDTAGNPFVIAYPKGFAGRYGRLSYCYDNRFVLMPFSVTASLEYGNNPANTGIGAGKEANYLKLFSELNFAVKYKQKHKKFRSRIFAGTFLYNSNTDGLQYFRVSGNTGYFDYLYKQALIGRSETSFGNSVMNRQLIVKDGNMRTAAPTPLISNGWILAGNFESTLPGILPVRLYADIGFSGHPVNKDHKAKDSYIGYAYTAGAALVIKEDVLEIYFPFAWSKDIQEYYKTNNITSYGEKMSFRLNLNLLNPFDIVKSFKF